MYIDACCVKDVLSAPEDGIDFFEGEHSFEELADHVRNRLHGTAVMLGYRQLKDQPNVELVERESFGLSCGSRLDPNKYLPHVINPADSFSKKISWHPQDQLIYLRESDCPQGPWKRFDPIVSYWRQVRENVGLQFISRVASMRTNSATRSGL